MRGSPDQKLIPYKGLKFRVQEFAEVVVEFVEDKTETEPSLTVGLLPRDLHNHSPDPHQSLHRLNQLL
jgi:hypothetical protein